MKVRHLRLALLLGLLFVVAASVPASAARDGVITDEVIQAWG